MIFCAFSASLYYKPSISSRAGKILSTPEDADEGVGTTLVAAQPRQVLVVVRPLPPTSRRLDIRQLLGYITGAIRERQSQAAKTAVSLWLKADR